MAPAELAATGRLIVLAAFAAGLAIGLRTQTAWLTLPLLVLVIADRAGRSAAAAIVGSAVTFTAGVLCWALPLVIASGGPAAYWQAIASQAGEDLEGVDMLFTSTRPLWRLAMNLLQTFVLPWGPLPLAVVVLTLAALGIVVLLRRDRRGLVLLAGAAAPYAIFHLVWQENVTTRYALPIVPPIALLAAIGLRGLPGWAGWAGTPGPGALGRWTARVGATAIAVLALAAGLPALTAYTREPAPVFRLFADMRSAGRPEDVVVAMHRRGHADTRRVRGWVGPAGFPWRLLDAPTGHEWLELVRYWREGGAGRTWLLADLRRTDLALIDPVSRHANGHYDWSTPFAAGVVGGTRPGALDWVVIDGPPAWFLGQGWALSPEIAGVSNVDGKGPSRGGAVGWMRRSAAPQAPGHRRPQPRWARGAGRPLRAAARRSRRGHLGRGAEPRILRAQHHDRRLCRSDRRRLRAGVVRRDRRGGGRIGGRRADRHRAIRPAAARRRAVRVRRRLARRRAPAADRPALAVVERRVLAPGLAGRSGRPNPPRRRIAPEDLRRSADSHVDGWRARARPGDTG